MTRTIISLLIPVVISIISTVNKDNESKNRKVIFVFLTIFGLCLGIYSALDEDNKKKNASDKQKQTDSTLQESNRLLKAARDSLNIVKDLASTINLTTNDLAALNKLTGKKSYCVVIATGSTKQELEKWRSKLYAMFDGAQGSDLVKIVQTKNGKYELLFGRNLSVASAEVFQRLATTHNLSNGLARIKMEN